MISTVRHLMRITMRHPIARHRPAAALLRIARWQLRSRGSSGPVVVPWVDDSRLVMRRGMTCASGNVYWGLGEFPDMAFVIHLLRPGDLFFDVGANVGGFTVLASKVCGAESWAFEPAAETVGALRANIDENGIDELVTVHQMAVGDQDGQIGFTVGLEAANHIAAEGDTDIQMVDICRLDTVARGTSPTFMKIDAEGAEPDVLAGGREILAAPSLLAIQIETEPSFPVHGPEMRRMLGEAGFVERYYDPFTRRLHEENVGLHPNNRLFVREGEALAARLREAPKRVLHGVEF